MLLKFRLLIGLLLLFSPPGFANDPLRLATTTSTDNSGLLDYLLPEFTRDTGFEIHKIAVGTGKALRLGRDGDVDVVLVHARKAEEDFISSGFGVDRADVMYNDFILVGAPEDPAGIRSAASAADAFARIAGGAQPFASRGDDSGTHKRELSIWLSTGVTPVGDWYRALGQGMGKTLQVANEMLAYTMTDRGTWLAYEGNLDLEILFDGDPPLLNPYGIIAVNPHRHAHINYDGASALIQWITSPKAQQLIGNFRVKGRQLFVPNAQS